MPVGRLESWDSGIDHNLHGLRRCYQTRIYCIYTVNNVNKLLDINAIIKVNRHTACEGLWSLDRLPVDWPRFGRFEKIRNSIPLHHCC